MSLHRERSAFSANCATRAEEGTDDENAFADALRRAMAGNFLEALLPTPTRPIAIGVKEKAPRFKRRAQVFQKETNRVWEERGGHIKDTRRTGRPAQRRHGRQSLVHSNQIWVARSWFHYGQIRCRVS
jgi:hypothetical protein